MITSSPTPPTFLSSYVSALRQSRKRRGWRAIFPGWGIACLVAGGLVAYHVPDRFWTPLAEDMASAVYVGVLTLNGLILVLSWNAFLRMHEIISDSNFGAYLYERELLNGYLFYMKYVNVSQIGALLISATSLLIFLCQASEAYNRMMFVLVIAASAYAIRQATAAVRAMHDLIWQKAVFDSYQIASGSDGAYIVRREDARIGS